MLLLSKVDSCVRCFQIPQTEQRGAPALAFAVGALIADDTLFGSFQIIGRKQPLGFFEVGNFEYAEDSAVAAAGAAISVVDSNVLAGKSLTNMRQGTGLVAQLYGQDLGFRERSVEGLYQLHRLGFIFGDQTQYARFMTVHNREGHDVYLAPGQFR